MLLVLTWRRGTNILTNKNRRTEVPLETLIRSLEKKPPHIVSGTAVFLTSEPAFAPTALLHNLKHNKVLHEHNVILTIITTDTPRVPEDERVTMVSVSPHFSQVALRFGYMEQPNVPKALAIARKLGWTFDIMATSFFLSRRSLKPAAHSGMPRWQDRLFIGLAKSASDATDFFQIPTGASWKSGLRSRFDILDQISENTRLFIIRPPPILTVLNETPGASPGFSFVRSECAGKSPAVDQQVLPGDEAGLC